MRILESSLERKVVAYAESIGYITFKVSTVSSRGWPDRVFIDANGHHIYVELKQAGKKPRKLQLHRIQQLHERGVEVHWTSDYATVKKILDQNQGKLASVTTLPPP